MIFCTPHKVYLTYDNELVQVQNGVIMTFKQYRRLTASWWRRLIGLY